MSNLLLTERTNTLANHGLTNLGLAGDVLELHVTTPGLPSKIARVADRTISLGAGPRCTVQLSAPGLRPMHCLITRTDTGLSVRRWANNTLLNGRSFSEAPLASGDRLSIGDCLVEIHSPTTSEVFLDPVADQAALDEEPIATVDEAAEMIAADLALDEPAVPGVVVDSPTAANLEALAPVCELAGPPVTPFTPSPVEAVATKPRALMAVPAHLLKPWQAANGDADSYAAEVVVAAPVVAEQSLTPVLETPVQPSSTLVAPPHSAPATDAETKDFLPLAAAVASPAEPAQVVFAEPLSTLEPTIERLRERLASSRQRMSRVANALRTERDSASAQSYELELLRAGLAAVTAERDELRLSNRQIEELHRELHEMQTELEALERQCEELRTAPAPEPAPVAEVALPVYAAPAGARAAETSDPWAEFELDSTPEPTAEVLPTYEPESAPQFTASFAGWKTDPQADSVLVEPAPAPVRQEVSRSPAAGLWEVESAYDASAPVAPQNRTNQSPADLWGAAEDSAVAVNTEFADSAIEPNADDACPDPFAEDAADWSPTVATAAPSLLDPTGEDSDAAESWSLADALQSATPTGEDDAPREGDVPRSPSEEPEASAPAEESFGEQAEVPAAKVATVESVKESVVAASEETALEAEELSQPVEAEEDAQPASEPKALSALFTPPPAAPATGVGSTSFIERYAHLLNDDAAPEPEPITPPAPVVAQPSPLAESDEDESIDDYMERLMQRMRGDASSPTVERAISRGGSPTPAAPARPQPAKPQIAIAMTAEELAPSEELLTSLDEMRRSGPAPEKTADMTALRALANQNARHNIGVANVRQHKEFAFVKFGVSLMVVGAGAVLALMAPELLGVQMIASCAAMLVAGFYAGRTARLLKEAVKTARAK